MALKMDAIRDQKIFANSSTFDLSNTKGSPMTHSPSGPTVVSPFEPIETAGDFGGLFLNDAKRIAEPRRIGFDRFNLLTEPSSIIGDA